MELVTSLDTAGHTAQVERITINQPWQTSYCLPHFLTTNK